MYNRSNARINYWGYLSRSTFQSSVSPFYFGYGRTALKVGLSSYGVSEGKKVLVPEYICGAALDPFKELGIAISYYKVNEDLSPDWNSVKQNISNDVCYLLMVHYFGIPQNIKVFKQFAEEHGLLLIEDNSHGHGGTVDKKLLGTYGEIGFSSPRKSFPILNGAVLFLNSKNSIAPIDLKPEPANIPKLIIRNLLGRVLDVVPTIKKNLLRKEESKIDYNVKVEDWGIDNRSHRILTMYDAGKVCSIRSELFRIWENWCRSIKLTPLFSLNNNLLAPLCMPLLFNSIIDRDEWLTIFKKNNVAAYIWPELPEELNHKENTGTLLRDRTLCLPIQLAMAPEELKDFLVNKFSIN